MQAAARLDDLRLEPQVLEDAPGLEIRAVEQVRNIESGDELGYNFGIGYQVIDPLLLTLELDGARFRLRAIIRSTAIGSVRGLVTTLARKRARNVSRDRDES